MKLIDSNVLVYAHDQASPKCFLARQILVDALTGKQAACITPQNLLEFYSVITNPKRVRHPLSPPVAHKVVHLYWRSRRLVKILPTAAVVDRFLQILATTGVSGADIFDAFLVATALEHGVTEAYTDNVADLTRFGLNAINPFAP